MRFIAKKLYGYTPAPLVDLFMLYRYNNDTILDVPNNVNGHEYAVGFIHSLSQDYDFHISTNAYCIINTCKDCYRDGGIILTDRRHREEETIGSYDGRLWKLCGKPLHVNDPIFVEFDKHKYNYFKVYTEEDLVTNAELREAFGVTINEVQFSAVDDGCFSVVGGGNNSTRFNTCTELHEDMKFCYGVTSDTIMAAREAIKESKKAYVMSFAAIPMSIFTA